MDTPLRKFFNLEKDPFGETPDTKFFYESPTHTDALARIQCFVQDGHGFGLLMGEVGTGKTLVSRLLLKSLESRASTGLVLFPKLNESEFLQEVCEEFELPVAPTRAGARTLKTYLDSLNSFLLTESALGRRCVLIIDEAQGLPATTLETIRLLSNLETERAKLLQIILIGQPELRDRLAEPGLRQLTQRIGLSLELNAFSPIETERYIKHRLHTAGRSNLIRIDPKAIPIIQRATGGIAREINRVGNALIEAAFQRRVRLLEAAFVRSILAPKKSNSIMRIFGSAGASP